MKEDRKEWGNNFRGDLESDDKKIGPNWIRVAMCNPKDDLIFEVRKPLIENEINKIAAKAKALIEGLNVALTLGLNHIVFYSNYYPLFQFMSIPSFPIE